jgi:DNA-binding winged helix-turn-helix (wHTH) protein
MAISLNRTLQFDSWQLDLGRRLLLRDGEPVHLSPKAFQLLQVLVERAPEAIAKNELHDQIWPDTFVTETNLAGLAAELRAALGDDARNPRYVRTVHGFGYAFAASVRASGEATHFRLFVQGREVALTTGDNVIGRNPRAAVFVDDASVSREHACITVTDVATLSDLGSKNGTFVNGVRTSSAMPLHNRDVIAVGSVTLTFHDTGSSQTTLTLG